MLAITDWQRRYMPPTAFSSTVVGVDHALRSLDAAWGSARPPAGPPRAPRRPLETRTTFWHRCFNNNRTRGLFYFSGPRATGAKKMCSRHKTLSRCGTETEKIVSEATGGMCWGGLGATESYSETAVKRSSCPHGVSGCVLWPSPALEPSPERHPARPHGRPAAPHSAQARTK